MHNKKYKSPDKVQTLTLKINTKISIKIKLFWSQELFQIKLQVCFSVFNVF